MWVTIGAGQVAAGYMIDDSLNEATFVVACLVTVQFLYVLFFLKESAPRPGKEKKIDEGEL